MEFDHIIEAIESNIDLSETIDLEFKSAKGGFPRSFWETYSAFANTEGGIIVLGVSEKKGKFYLDGLSTDVIEKYKKDFWNQCHNKQCISKCLLTDSDVKEVEISGHTILLFRIRQADRSQRPVYRGMSAEDGTYKRNEEGDYPCEKDEVRRMFADADINRPPDSRILKNYTIEDIDIPSLDQFRRLFAISKPDHPWLALDDIELLRCLGGYRKDRVTNEEGFTLAGLLMFGKTQSINDPECAPHFFPDYRLYSSENPGANERWIDRICPDGKWEANLFQFYRRVLPKLTSVLPTPFKLDEDTRIDETSAHIAIREALINSCIHADYTVNASLVISQYPHKIVLSNPGTMLITRWQYYKGGESVCRNISLQKMFTMFGKAEKAGSGSSKILQGWQENNWKRPYLGIVSKPDKVELTLELESFLSDFQKKKLLETFGEKYKAWETEKLMVMASVCSLGEVSNESLQFVLPNHRADITCLLRRLKTEGLLESEGYGRGTKYHIAQHLLAKDNQNIDSITTEIMDKNTSSEQNSTSSEQNSTSSEQNSTSSEQNSTSSNIRKKMSMTDRRLMVQKFTNEVFRSTTEIAKNLGLSDHYTKRAIVGPMVKEGLLKPLYPNKGTHPYQKYTNANKKLDLEIG